MWRDYTPKKDKYIKPEEWKRIVSVIKDYQRLKAEYCSLTNNASRVCSEEVSDIKLTELKRKIMAFETAYEAADKETKELVGQRFWKKRKYRDVMLPMSESTMKRYVRRFIVEVGKNLGEI